MNVPPFHERYAEALRDDDRRRALLDFQRSWRDTRDAQVAELEAITGASFDELRARLAAAKQRVRDDWEASLAAFTAGAEAAGAVVHRAASAAEANDVVAGICRSRSARLVVKGKSMATEEIGLNDHLDGRGVVAVETDLGEWLLQLGGERPTHLVMPAIHKRRDQVAAILEAALGRPFDPDDIIGMVRSARTELRERFAEAAVGVTGANALVADSGVVVLVCNEGNNRLSVALPRTHVVVAGIDKLVGSIADALLQVRLLARSATGQPITTYTSFVAGPRPGGEQHIVLVDNGRTAMAASPVAAALDCIRCGACANVCPPYQVVGGQVFGHVYTGAIGLVNTAFHHGLEAAADPQSLCVSCGACTTVCPAGIPLAEQILDIRSMAVRGADPPGLPRWTMRALAHPLLVAVAARAAAVVTRPLARDGFLRLPFARRHTSWRTPPSIPWRPARALARTALREVEPVADTAASGRRVALFLQCLTDRLLPGVALDTARLVRATGAEVVVPRSQHCCGLPALDAGHRDLARVMARRTIAALEGAPLTVTPSPSCAVAITRSYPELFADDPVWRPRALALRGRVLDLVSFLSGPGRLPDGSLARAPRDPQVDGAGGAGGGVTVHRFCQSGNVLGHDREQEVILERLCGVRVEPLPESGTCCGFGGQTSLTAPEVAAGIMDRKLTCLDDCGAATLVTDNPGCVLHLRGGVHASGRGQRVEHVAEFLARRLPGRTG